MKKIITLVAVAAVALSGITACGNKPKESGNEIPVAIGDVDTLSYMTGVNFGLMVKQQFGILDLDLQKVREGINDFILSGNVEDTKFLDRHQQFTAFMNSSKLREYGMAKYQRDLYQGDRPDTLPALPEIYDQENSRSVISYIVGNLVGADMKSSGEEISRAWAIDGFDDAQLIEDYKEADQYLNVPMEELNNYYIKYTQERRMREYEKAMAELAENKAACTEWLAEIEKQEGVQKTESGILYRIDREGTGAYPTKDEDVVMVNYEGKVRSGEVFDSSYERGEPISFPLNRVIKGWTEGMKLINVGGQITLWIPSDLAYGDRPQGDVIGPGEALEFKVELLEINPEN